LKKNAHHVSCQRKTKLVCDLKQLDVPPWTSKLLNTRLTKTTNGFVPLKTNVFEELLFLRHGA